MNEVREGSNHKPVLGRFLGDDESPSSDRECISPLAESLLSEALRFLEENLYFFLLDFPPSRIGRKQSRNSLARGWTDAEPPSSKSKGSLVSDFDIRPSIVGSEEDGSGGSIDLTEDVTSHQIVERSFLTRFTTQVGPNGFPRPKERC